MDQMQTQPLPVITEEESAGGPSPDDTSPIPVVAEPESSRLYRATNLLARGLAAEAAVLCREEIEYAPNSADAYALLAMAEEQRGMVALAVELYEQLLEIDPGRTAEAEHLEELRRELLEMQAEEPTAEEQEQELRKLQPIAMVVLIGAAVFLVMSFALLLTVRHRNAVTYRQYKAALTNGAYYYNGRQFDNAAAWFREAQRLRPREQAAQVWYNQSVQQSRLAAQYPAQAAPPLLTINPNANPFAPVPIGPTATPAPPPLTYPAGIPPPPAIYGPGRTADWQANEPTPQPPPRVGTPGGSGQIITPPTPGGTPPPATGGTPGGTATVQPPVPPPAAPEPQPMIRIEVVERPPARTQSALERAESLRSKGNSLSGQGRWAEAKAAYEQALSAYQSGRSAVPEKRAAIDRSIDSVQAQIGVCEQQLH